MTKKRIAIDARMIRASSMHGIARYVHQLLDCLKNMGEGFEFFVLINPESPLECQRWPDHIHMVIIKAPWISFREQWELPKILRDNHIDLFHAPSFVAPLLCRCKLLMTIHDLNHLVLPQFYTPFHQFYYYTFVRSCMRRSESIITVSNFSKDEIVRNLQINPVKIKVTYNGVAQNYHPIDDEALIQYVRDIYELPSKFIFCLSNNKPHKNVLQLVRAYCFSKIEMPLVLASDVDPNLILLAEKYGKKHLLYFTKFIAEEHLPVIYSMTHLFVYPSTYEGFGLPPLEALACGAPVVVAQAASLPEVVGHHAIFMNPYDYKDIANALEKALSDESLRTSLKNRGLNHARHFSWQNMTIKTLEIYSEALHP